eukprot:1160284-Pelagomonas_calceolata.AAC.6
MQQGDTCPGTWDGTADGTAHAWRARAHNDHGCELLMAEMLSMKQRALWHVWYKPQTGGEGRCCIAAKCVQPTARGESTLMKA